MRSLDAIILPASLMMPGRQPKIPEGRSVGAKLVRDDRARRQSALLYQLSYELERGPLVTPGLHEDIEDLSVLVYRAPEVTALSVHRDKHLVEVPQRVRPRPMTSKATSDLRAEPGNPAADRLVGHLDSTLGEQLLDVTKAQGKAGIEPHRMLDNLRREVAVTVADLGHQPILPVA